MTIYLYSFIAVFLVSLVSLVGIFFISLEENFLKKYIAIFISLAVGALLGDAFIHIIPEVFESGLSSNTASLIIVGGILLFFIIEKFMHWHHHAENEDLDIHPVGKLVLFTDGFHNFIDGAILGASFIVSVPVGIATTLAVILHEIPQEIGDFAVLIHSGYTKKRALFWNFISALTAFAGLALVLIFGNITNDVANLFMPIAAGGFIYIAVADLIPELHKHKNIKDSIYQILACVLGVFLMMLLIFLE